MSKYISSWWVEKLDNGIIHLLINCSQREIYYHSFNDDRYIICGTEEEYENHSKDCILELPQNIVPKNDGNIWITTSMKEKDQLSFYFIPYERNLKRSRNIILSSNK